MNFNLNKLEKKISVKFNIKRKGFKKGFNFSEINKTLKNIY